MDARMHCSECRRRNQLLMSGGDWFVELVPLPKCIRGRPGVRRRAAPVGATPPQSIQNLIRTWTAVLQLNTHQQFNRIWSFYNDSSLARARRSIPERRRALIAFLSC
ncbi:hypothetical protein H310_13949 [Aphanomyces invadans]|uniref:Uncharacterized protein n=1 Tax=Aphanomyces invadans TaxID=157072 RepID=A0A024TC41_9STRA|nr:hypothetical protein H310_13949 [Aphanomyces invadans]ETV91569.1 hypothetical protein H310_13949 [Aphanomyces invadans]|eukprot:XP_008879837.1 hypothetical protein H310_13949 [Aphanomyces invadans]